MNHFTLISQQQPNSSLKISLVVLYVQGFSIDWCKNPDVGLPKPDLVMFLQLNPSVAENRGEFGSERYETSHFQNTVHQRFEELMEDTSVNWKVRVFYI